MKTQISSRHQNCDFSHQIKALWLPLHSLEVSHLLLSASSFRFPATCGATLDYPSPSGSLPSSVYRLLGMPLGRAWLHPFLRDSLGQVQGILTQASQGSSLKELLVQVEQGVVKQRTWSRSENCAGSIIMFSSVHWSLYLPVTPPSHDDAEVIQPAKTPPCLMTLARPHSLDGSSSATYLQPSSNMPPYQDMTRSLKAVTESRLYLHPNLWLRESLEFNLPILKCPLL